MVPNRLKVEEENQGEKNHHLVEAGVELVGRFADCFGGVVQLVAIKVFGYVMVILLNNFYEFDYLTDTGTHQLGTHEHWAPGGKEERSR